MKIDFTNIFETNTVSKKEFDKSGEKISNFLEKIENRKQGFYKIFDDSEFISEVEEIKKFAGFCAGKYNDIVVCGIGGSSLGAITIRDSLTNSFSQKPRLHVLENIDPEIMCEISENLDFPKTLFIIISKSGGTIEPISQYFHFRKLAEEKNINLQENFVFVTSKSGVLFEEAKKNNIKTFSVPENIGGRFSVLTAVGLLPAALIGINIDDLLMGGQNSAKLFMSENFNENLPFQLASAYFLSQKTQNMLLPYSSKLKSLGNWLAQLIEESTGKNGKGITIIPAVGATDQHSQLQLLADGPNDKLITFIEVEKFSRDFLIPNDENYFSKDISFGELLNAEKKGTEQSLTEKKRANLTIKMPEISAKSLGELFVLFMGATAFLGEFMEINAFDQPGVERGKILTKSILAGNS